MGSLEVILDLFFFSLSMFGLVSIGVFLGANARFLPFPLLDIEAALVFKRVEEACSGLQWLTRLSVASNGTLTTTECVVNL